MGLVTGGLWAREVEVGTSGREVMGGVVGEVGLAFFEAFEEAQIPGYFLVG